MYSGDVGPAPRMDIPTLDDTYQGLPQARGHAGLGAEKHGARTALDSFRRALNYSFVYHFFCGIYWFLLVLYEPIG